VAVHVLLLLVIMSQDKLKLAQQKTDAVANVARQNIGVGLLASLTIMLRLSTCQELH